MSNPPAPKRPARFDSLELPDHIIYSILLNLPLKALGQFLCLSKHWGQIIASSRFANQLLQSASPSAASCNVFYLVASGNYENRDPEFVSTLVEYSQKQEQYPIVIHLSIEARPSNFPTECRYMSCNGLLCFVKLGECVDNSCITVRNDAIGKHRTLVWPPLLDNPFEVAWFSFIGFGYEPITDDYKVIFLTQAENAERISIPFDWKVQVLSLKENKWRTIFNPEMSCYLVMNPISDISSVAVNGDVYWIACCVGQSSSFMLMRFSLAKESFTFLRMPVRFKDVDERNKCNLATLNGLLYMFVWESESFLENPRDSSRRVGMTSAIDIWMLKGHTTWCKVSTIPTKEYRKSLHPVGFNMCGHVMMVDWLDGSLIVYIPKENRFVKVGTGKVDPLTLKEFHMVQMESLVIP